MTGPVPVVETGDLPAPWAGHRTGITCHPRVQRLAEQLPLMRRLTCCRVLQLDHLPAARADHRPDFPLHGMEHAPGRDHGKAVSPQPGQPLTRPGHGCDVTGARWISGVSAQHTVGGLGLDDALTGQPAHDRCPQRGCLSLGRLNVGDDLKVIAHSGTITADRGSPVRKPLLLRVLIAETGPVTERLRVRQIDDDEGRRLVRIVRRDSGSVVTWRRAQMVLLSAQGMDVAGIARVAFTSEDRVRDVIHNFNADGFGSLYPRYRGGHPPKFTLPQRREVKKIAKSRPAEHGLPFSTWSLAKLAEFLVAEGVVDDISHEGLRVLLGEEGVTFQRLKTGQTLPDAAHDSSPSDA